MPSFPSSTAAERPAGPPPDEDLVVVQFKGHRKGYFHNRRGLDLAVNQYCLVEADRGRDLGQVAYVGAGTEAWWQEAMHRGVIALARSGERAGDAGERRAAGLFGLPGVRCDRGPGCIAERVR